jgi:hypothetical protein
MGKHLDDPPAFAFRHYLDAASPGEQATTFFPQHARFRVHRGLVRVRCIYPHEPNPNTLEQAVYPEVDQQYVVVGGMYLLNLCAIYLHLIPRYHGFTSKIKGW